MGRKGLILNTSYDDFEIGSNISKYYKLTHSVDRYDIPYSWECYNYSHDGVEIELWCENKIVKNICCSQSCIYKGKELINMNFNDFLQAIEEIPESHDVIYVPTSNKRGQNQQVYDFEESGLQIWVWRNRIKTVIISNSNNDS